MTLYDLYDHFWKCMTLHDLYDFVWPLDTLFKWFEGAAHLIKHSTPSSSLNKDPSIKMVMFKIDLRQIHNIMTFEPSPYLGGGGEEEELQSYN